MVSRPHLAALLRVAIVTIAVQMSAATAALAHAGHTHAQHSISTDAYERANGDANLSSAPRANAEHTGRAAQVAAIGLGAERAAATGMCKDGCCTSGFSCCAPAMLSEAIADLPSGLRRQKVVRLRTPMRPGIDPETLPKPPKSFT